MSIDYEIPFTYRFQHVGSIHRARVNRRSLAAEARFIREETRRAGPAYRGILIFHRTRVLRYEARIAHVAFAFLRGRRYRQAERNAIIIPDATEIAKKLKRWGYYQWKDHTADVARWLAE